MTTLTPSPELDRRIAEACKPDYVKILFHGVYRSTDGVGMAPWSPSTNLNHAFEAAEAVLKRSKFNLFRISGGDSDVADWSQAEIGYTACRLNPASRTT